MVLAAILDPQKDIEPYFGIRADDDPSEYRLVLLLAQWIEAAARRFVRHGISQDTYTEYHRRRDIGYVDRSGGHYELVGTKVYNSINKSREGHILQLNNGFVRSVASVYEDFSAESGQGATDFGASTLLTAGTEYKIEWQEEDLSKSGRLIRIQRAWSTKPGTIKVTYTAGLSQSELSDQYSFIKMALMDELKNRYNSARSQRQSFYGPVKKEVWHGDKTVEYAVDTKTMARTGLSLETMSALQPIKAMIL